MVCSSKQHAENGGRSLTSRGGRRNQRTLRRALLLTLIVLGALPLAAQREQDFASRFMADHGAAYAMTNKTISPKMMARIMQLDGVGERGEARTVLSQIKSARILTAEDAADAKPLFRKADSLARRNARRYTPYAHREGLAIYLRKRGEAIVEIVMLQCSAKARFTLTNLTGMMQPDILDRILRI